MQIEEGARTPYEVYCHNCRVSFPVGTRRCIHCGGRIGQRRLAAVPGPIQTQPQPEIGDEEAIGEPSIGRRLGTLSLWMLVAIGAAIYRACAES